MNINEIIETLLNHEILTNEIIELSNKNITEFLMVDDDYCLKIFHPMVGNYLDVVSIEIIEDDYIANVILPIDADDSFEQDLKLTTENFKILKVLDITTL